MCTVERTGQRGVQFVMAVQNISQHYVKAKVSGLDYAKAYYCGFELSLKGHDNETLFSPFINQRLIL